MDTNPTTTLDRQAAINGLAVVGFIALVTAGVWLAIYSTRFVPTVVNRIGAAAVYLGSVFTPSPGSSLSVVPAPVASTTIPFGATASASTTATSQTAPVAKPAAPSTSVHQVAETRPVVLSGLPDLAVSIVATGYLASASTDTFVASSSVPYGGRPAVLFTIKNAGTNWSGTWRFSVSIPTSPAYTFKSDVQQSLAPGDSIEYTLGFDRVNSGADQTVTITANFDNAAAESNTNNNSISANFTVLASS